MTKPYIPPRRIGKYVQDELFATEVIVPKHSEAKAAPKEDSDLKFVLEIYCDDEADIEKILRVALKDVHKGYEHGAETVGCIGQYRYTLQLNDADS